MISICIPVYNNDVKDLVALLIAQIEKARLNCEILLYDDGSEEHFVAASKQLATYSGVHFFEGGINKGRIEARKALAAQAQNNWLLFIDSDSKILHENFLTSYLDACIETADVVVGGRMYSIKKPAHCRQMLHWKYGTRREKTDDRFIFMTNNFCIRKTIFQQMNFPECLHGYGHEDTWMGIQLKNVGARIVYIQNTVLHAHIEDAETFIKKSEQALLNVVALESIVPKNVLQDFIKLYRFYHIQQQLHLSWLLTTLEKLFHNTILKNLNSCHPSLRLFDFYRLATFIRLQRKKSS